jgi:hypothetical protein
MELFSLEALPDDLYGRLIPDLIERPLAVVRKVQPGLRVQFGFAAQPLSPNTKSVW